MGQPWTAPDEFTHVVVGVGDYNLVTYQKITDRTSPIRIYIEGDGHAFDAHGRPTSNPTPHGTMLRDMAVRDGAKNVVYIARPCQFIMSPACHRTDWTSGRFSAPVVDSVAAAVWAVAGSRPVVLIGYSGGATISGLIINRHPELNVVGWITIAGVLNHADWTSYFNDSPLTDSLSLDELPHIPGCHYIASNDRIVPNALSRRWLGDDGVIVVPKTTHGNFGDFVPTCTNIE